MSPHDLRLGIDFGTTNSSVARVLPDGGVDLVLFPHLAAPNPSSRSLLYVEQHRSSYGRVTQSSTGSAAIARYLERSPETPGRLIQSLKSYLPVASLTGTEIFGRRYALEDLVSRILTDLRLAAERHFGHPIAPDTPVTVGRPVRFVGAENDEDEARALTRLRSAFHTAGFRNLRFELEPVAAAFAYESTLIRAGAPDQLILIGDFGGGTSDFSLLRVGSSARTLPAAERVLGTAGVPLAGDAFDARLIRYLVAPALGSESVLPALGGKSLPLLPSWIFRNLERWHYLSFLRTRPVEELLRSARLRAAAVSDSSTRATLIAQVDALSTLIDEDLGYQLHASVQRTKQALSTASVAGFTFTESGLSIQTSITRATFEHWIAPELQAIAGAVDTLLERTATPAAAVDRVFLTGGSSFVPAVRALFASRFGPQNVTSGEAFTSVAQGLALSADSHLASVALATPETLA